MVVNGGPVWLSDIGLPLARSCRGLPDHQLSQQNHRLEVAEEIARRSNSAATRPFSTSGWRTVLSPASEAPGVSSNSHSKDSQVLRCIKDLGQILS